MKFALTAFALTLSSATASSATLSAATASAQTVSAAVFEKVQAAVIAQCDAAHITDLEIVSVQTREVKIDQGQVDLIHVIRMYANEKIDEQFFSTRLTAEVLEASISNPGVENVQVLRLESALCNSKD